MAFDLASISHETRIRAPRIIVIGESKVGKSTFAASAPNPAILPIKGEEGVDDLRNSISGEKLAVEPLPVCLSLDDVMGWFGALYTQEHDYQTVVVDSASTLEHLVWEDVCRRNGNVDGIEKVGGGWAKGYTESLPVWRRITEALDALRADRGMASIIIGHTRIRRHDDPLEGGYDRFEWDIHDKASSLLFRWADAILFAGFKTVVRHEDVGFGKEAKRAIDITGGQRFLYTQHRPGHPGGGRGVYGRLSYELPLLWSAFQDAVAAAI